MAFVVAAELLAHHPAPTAATRRDRVRAASLAMVGAVAVGREEPAKRVGSWHLARKWVARAAAARVARPADCGGGG